MITERTKEVSDYLAFLLFKENAGLTTLEDLDGQYIKDDGGEWSNYFVFKNRDYQHIYDAWFEAVNRFLNYDYKDLLRERNGSENDTE